MKNKQQQIDTLQFLYDRLINVYKESPNVGYVRELKELIEELTKQLNENV